MIRFLRLLIGLKPKTKPTEADPTAPGAAPTKAGTTPGGTANASTPGHGPRWQQTVVGRLLIGLVLAQGLFYGLRHLLTGVLLAMQETEGDLWEDSRNVFLLFSIQLFAAFVGGVFAGSGQRYGYLLGVFVGLWNGVLAALLRQNPAGEFLSLGFLTHPLSQSGTALLGGVIGSLVWRPIIHASTTTLAPTTKKATSKKRAVRTRKLVHAR